jgi:hypothetical protein
MSALSLPVQHTCGRKEAKVPGLTVPQSLLALADDVIE